MEEREIEESPAEARKAADGVAQPEVQQQVLAVSLVRVTIEGLLPQIGDVPLVAACDARERQRGSGAGSIAGVSRLLVHVKSM